MVRREESKQIPENDLRDINAAFRKDVPAKTIIKTGQGNPVERKDDVINPRGYVLSHFIGRRLKHDKSLIPKGGRQITIARKGMLFEDIPFEDRQLVTWFEADFE